MRRVVRSGFARLLAVCSILLSLLTTSLHAQQRQALQADVSAPAGAKFIGPMPASQQLNLAVTLPLGNQEQLHTLLQQLYDPASPNYRHFLTVSQFTEQFGPSVVDYQRVTGLMESHGLKVTHTYSDRLAINVTGSVANIEQTFQVTMQVYQHPSESRTFYAPDVEPSVELGFPVLSVEGLSTYNLPRPMLKRASPDQRVHSDQTGSGPSGQFLGSDIRAAYGAGTALDGSGQTLGLIELGPYNLSDVTAYFNSVSQPLNVPIVNVLLGGADGICSGCNDGEEAIDVEQIISMAPNASGLIVYLAYNSNVSAYNAYLQAANDNIVKQMSISFGWSGTPSSEQDYETVFEELAAQGQSSFVASGDAGANCGGGGYPGNSPNITDAGGTDLTTSSAGGPWQSETGWVGSGGGWNTESPIPSYQQGAGIITSANEGSTQYRNIPDVAAEANTDNYFCSSGSCQGGIGGTSLAAPRWAGFVALINQQAAANATAAGNNPTLGLLNPTIYGTPVDADFHDITSGSDYNSSSPSGCTSTEFSAGPGFDLVTGWGSPNGPTLINALAPTSANANFSMSATPSTLSLTPGLGGTSSIAVTALNGFSAITNLTVTIPGTSTPSNAPPGLTANLSSTSIPAGGSPVTLTVSTTSATPGGTYLVAVTGTSGGLTQTAYITLELPWFELVPTPETGVSINQGGTAAIAITVDPFNGFNSNVSLSAPTSGLPTGVTASLNPTSTKSTSTLTLTAGDTATLTGAGSPAATVATITGTSAGVTTQSTTVSNLFVNPPITGGSGTAVNLSSGYNIYGFYTDAAEPTITPTNSLDGVGSVYSANLLNSGLDFNGVQFSFGPANAPNAVTGSGSGPIALPAGSFATLQMLATGIEGNQASQAITVTYTDNSSSQFTQSFSDWCSALNGGGCVSTGNNPGESVAVAMPYRDTTTGPDNRVFYLYHYSFALNTNKMVQSLTLPNNRDVVVLAVSLTPPTPGYSLSAGTASPTSVSPGSSASATVSVVPASGYTGTVTLSCSIAPVVSPAPTCSFGSTSPVTVTSTGGSATLTFIAIGPSGATIRRSSMFYALWLPVPGLALIGFGFGSRSSRRKNLMGLLLLWTVLASLIVLPACGSSSGGGGGGGNGGTPAGAYMVTISGADANGVTQSNTAPTTVGVTVN
jgi:Pro-kumamolisin, activation domain